MTCTRKNLKILSVKFFGKIGGMLVANLAYVIVHHLKSICRTVCMGYFFNLNSCYRDKKNKLTFSLLIKVNSFREVFHMTQEKANKYLKRNARCF